MKGDNSESYEKAENTPLNPPLVRGEIKGDEIFVENEIETSKIIHIDAGMLTLKGKGILPEDRKSI